MITVGIDIGSLATKAVAINSHGQLLSESILLTGGNNRKSAEKVFDNVLAAARINGDELGGVVTTGYGRENVPFADRHVTEITCHAVGINALLPAARTIIEIGGQDTKCIHLDGGGKVLNFVMNDKCAAGTGRFCEVLANALGVRLDELGGLSQRSSETVKISSMCTVFAESEVVSLVAKGRPVTDIIRGVHDAIAERTTMLLKRLSLITPLAISGGVANNVGMIKCLEEKLNTTILVPEHPQIVGAMGAAILAQRLNRSTGRQ